MIDVAEELACALLGCLPTLQRHAAEPASLAALIEARRALSIYTDKLFDGGRDGVDNDACYFERRAQRGASGDERVLLGASGPGARKNRGGKGGGK